MKKEQQNLYRKLGKSPWYCEEMRTQSKYKYHRGTKLNIQEIKDEIKHQGMKPKKTNWVNGMDSYHGYDYTPAIRYLYKQIGRPWKRIWNTIQYRLPGCVNIEEDLGVFDNINQKVLELSGALEGDSEKAWRKFSIQRLGEGSYWKAFMIDDLGNLQFVDPDYSVDKLKEDIHFKYKFKGITITWEGKIIREDEN